MKSFALSLTLALAFAGVSTTTLRAEDWKTTDGKAYQNVQVVKEEPDAVTIVHDEGSARVPMEKLPPDLQKRFDYDPHKARDAREARDAKAQAEQQLAEAQQMAQAAIDAQNTQNSSPNTTTPSSSATSAHYTMEDLLDFAGCLSAGSSDHYSMESLLASTHPLEPSTDANHHSMAELGGGL